MGCAHQRVRSLEGRRDRQGCPPTRSPPGVSLLLRSATCGKHTRARRVRRSNVGPVGGRPNSREAILISDSHSYRRDRWDAWMATDLDIVVVAVKNGVGIDVSSECTRRAQSTTPAVIPARVDAGHAAAATTAALLESWSCSCKGGPRARIGTEGETGLCPTQERRGLNADRGPGGRHPAGGMVVPAPWWCCHSRWAAGRKCIGRKLARSLGGSGVQGWAGRSI